MAQFVGQHRFDLLFVQQVEQPFGDGYGGVLGVASRRECVGDPFGDDVDFGHRYPGFLREPSDDGDEPRRAALVHLHGVVVCQDHFVRKVVGVEVHGPGEQQGDDHAGRSAEHAADPDHQQCHECQKNNGFDCFHNRVSFGWKSIV